MVIIGLDDTDTLVSRGTGHLARQIAAVLAGDFAIAGVTRHQLLADPRIPSTNKNSSAAILLDGAEGIDPADLLANVRALMLDAFQPGSDPGLCILPAADPAIVAFGWRAKREIVHQAEARTLAAAHGALLVGLGGSEDGVIGALAAAGLAASGEDGRYVLVGRSRELAGLQPVTALLAAGIAAVQTADGQPVTQGLVLADKLRPARRGSRPVAVVERAGDTWLPLKLD